MPGSSFPRPPSAQPGTAHCIYNCGEEERPGTHEPIIDEATWAAGRKAADARMHGRRERGPKRRTYLLAGIIICRCGIRLRGETRVSRDKEWRYYLCRECGAPSVPAAVAEATVLERIRDMILPADAVQSARDELRRRLALPAKGLVDERRVKLERHLKRLAQLYEWDDMDETQYRAKAGETRMQLALLPQNDKVCSFDEVAEIVESLPAALDRATPDQAKQLLAMVVQEVTTEGRTVAEITLRPEATPFFDLERGDLVLAPPDGFEPPTRSLGRCRSIH